MSLFRSSLVGALAIVTLLVACDGRKESLGPQADDRVAPAPAFTLGSGSTPTLLGRATFGDPADPNFKVKRITGDWHVEVKSHGLLDVAVQSIVFQPGGHSGWHSHPGPVFIQVVAGAMTFYESNDPTCTPIVRMAGQSYLDEGEHAHIARNETTAPATNIVTYLAPPGAALRIDEPSPGSCPF